MSGSLQISDPLFAALIAKPDNGPNTSSRGRLCAFFVPSCLCMIPVLRIMRVYGRIVSCSVIIIR